MIGLAGTLIIIGSACYAPQDAPDFGGWICFNPETAGYTSGAFEEAAAACDALPNGVITAHPATLRRVSCPGGETPRADISITWSNPDENVTRFKVWTSDGRTVYDTRADIIPGATYTITLDETSPPCVYGKHYIDGIKRDASLTECWSDGDRDLVLTWDLPEPVTLSWENPTLNADGTPLTDHAGTLIDCNGLTWNVPAPINTWRMDLAIRGDYSCFVKAYDFVYNYSAPSNVITGFRE